MNEKRELIEKALGQFWEMQAHPAWPTGDDKLIQIAEVAELNIDALAEQATIEEINIVHMPCDKMGPAVTAIDIGNPYRQTICLDGIFGTPGPAIAIILPLKEEL